jgi:HAD domain in Swiss Army Knife RNA repair proteins
VILFLDFDGVLHPVHGSSEVFTEVPRLARWLARWPGVDVVISSSWREVHSQGAMVGLLGPEVGARVIGCTPLLTVERMLGRQGWARAPNQRRWERQEEVLAWLRASWQPRRAWVALDDLPYLFEPNCARLVVCDGSTGLTDTNLVELDAQPPTWGASRLQRQPSGRGDRLRPTRRSSKWSVHLRNWLSFTSKTRRARASQSTATHRVVTA